MTKGQALQRTCAGASKGFLLKMRMGLSKQDLGKGEMYILGIKLFVVPISLYLVALK